MSKLTVESIISIYGSGVKEKVTQKREKKTMKAMNKQGSIKLMQASAWMELAKEILEEVKDEEESACENLPEGLQNSECEKTMQEAIDNLERTYDCLEDAISSVEDILKRRDYKVWRKNTLVWDGYGSMEDVIDSIEQEGV